MKYKKILPRKALSALNRFTKSTNEVLKRHLVENMEYRVHGELNGSLFLFADRTSHFAPALGEQKNGVIAGTWTYMPDGIKVFDHWLYTSDQGRTWYSYKVKLEMKKDSLELQFKNSSKPSFSSAFAAYNAKRLNSREDDLLKLMPRNAVVAELGVEAGIYAETIKQVASPRELHLVDVWDDCAEPWPSAEEQSENHKCILERYASDIAMGRVIVHKGNDLEYVSRFHDGYFDWMYIDTTHQYELTLRELKLADIKVKDDGFICGHDYTDDTHSRRWGFGVIRAVNEFTRNSKWRITYLTSDKPTSFVLQKTVC
jgi:hypothetical protein